MPVNHYVPENKRRLATPEQVAYLRENSATMRISEMAKSLGVGDFKIIEWMKEHNIVKVRIKPTVKLEPDIDDNGFFRHDRTYFF